ncbi:hypothetical protein FGO68_gene12229 [Halteria grandinella]|uniref:AIG1-type G domain-containing protein n=1 Tax=Halteria grandinella TaxID=5974 RepID=A0A8J8P611_HALGN|nr:hypothetical protein FGO68_gene12229 [Halteria grandinella]
MESSTPVKIIIVGKTGTGKSTLSNEFVGTSRFAVSSSLKSQTKKCQIEKGTYQGQKVEIIDTPGFLDSSGSDQEIMTDIFECLMNYSQQGFNICVMPISAMDPRLDGGTVNILKLVTTLLTQKSLLHMFIVITQLNNLNATEQAKKIDIIRQQLPKMLQQEDLGSIANLHQLIFYRHGQRPTGLEPLAAVMPSFKQKVFKPKLDEDAQYQYMHRLLRDQIQADKKERQQLLDDADALKASTITGAQHLILWKLILKKTITGNVSMPCSNGHDLNFSQKSRGFWIQFDHRISCRVCNDNNLLNYNLYLGCFSCNEFFCAVCYHKFGQMQTTEQITPECLKTTRVNCHSHPLRRSFTNFHWECDGYCGFNAGSGNSMKRYNCPNCDYDLCQNCLNKKQI